MAFWTGKLKSKPPKPGFGASTPRRRGEVPAGAGLRFGRFMGNVGLLLALWLMGVLFINLGGGQRYASLAIGQRAPATVVASVDFECVNIAATELARRQASESVVPVFRVQTGPLQMANRTIDVLADRAANLHAQPEELADVSAADVAVAEAVEDGDAAAAAAKTRGRGDADRVSDMLGVPLSGEALEKLFPAGGEVEVADLLKQSLGEVWLKGILSAAEAAEGFPGLPQSSTLDIRETGGSALGRTVALSDLPAPAAAREAFADMAALRLEALKVTFVKRSLLQLAETLVQPNLAYDVAATQDRRHSAGRNLAPIQMTVRAGTTLMEERADVTAQTVELISAYNKRMAELESPFDRRMKRGGDYALMLIVLVVCVGWFQCTQPGAFSKSRRKWLLVLLALLSVGIESGYHFMAVELNWIPPWLVPFSIPLVLPAMIAALMLGPSAALAVGLWSSLSAALVFDRSFELLMLGLGGAAMAAVHLRNVRKRAQVMRAGLSVGVVEGVMALALAALYQHIPSTFLTQVAVGFISSVFAVVVALLLLPLMEWMFRHTTDITLLELTDMAHPLLQRLAMEAPGTFHHSLMVSAIGQAAANRIGADGLQVAVCASFHDIGKLAKPEFFTENQRSGENPHDNLAPSMSALIIQSHVKEGVTLAKRHKLPKLVVDGIRTHHGTTLTSYFFLLARRELQENGRPEDPGLEHAFRYGGPRPWTREQAVLMLADTVEAASRSLEKATPSRITEMVTTLMREKLLDGQLDRCPLTLEDYHALRASFIFSLTNILHGRNPYPRTGFPLAPAPIPEPAAGSSPA